MDKIKEVKRIANNALYFDDNSDYGTALWEILQLVAPELFVDEHEPVLEYIEDDEGEPPEHDDPAS